MTLCGFQDYRHGIIINGYRMTLQTAGLKTTQQWSLKCLTEELDEKDIRLSK